MDLATNSKKEKFDGKFRAFYQVNEIPLVFMSRHTVNMEIGGNTG